MSPQVTSEASVETESTPTVLDEPVKDPATEAKAPVAKKQPVKKVAAKKTPVVKKETALKATKRVAAKKVAAKKVEAKKAPVKKPAASKKAKATSPKEPRAKKEGLRKPQVRILAALRKANKPLTRSEISEKAPADLAWMNSWIGSNDDSIRAENDKKFPSLLSLKMVKFAAAEDESKTAYEITAIGRKALEKTSD
jgi:outer membrane biosynthesis protein TonB